MSDMDGVSEAKDLVKRAHDWGHPAIAITDHGVVQGFTDANHVIEDLDKDDPFKVIYGVEGYLVDDLTKIAENEKGQDLEGTYVVFDIETTGFSAVTDRIIEIGAVKVEDGKITDKFSTFVNPKRPIPFRITELTSITDEMVIGSPDIETILPQFIDFIGDAVLVAHNASFDVGFIEQNCKRQKIETDFTYVDTVALARVLLPALNRFKLDTVAKVLNISLENHHRAVDDAGCTAEIFVKFVQMLKERDLTTLSKVNEFGDLNPDSIKKLPTYHVIILARNDIGRVNLYQLVSASHLVYYNRRPRIPKSVLNERREGLIVGSACEAGELYRALLDGKPDETIAKIVDFYDYLEIQPLGNNAFMVESDKVTSVNSMEDIMDLNRKIVRLGEQFHKPVVGTCDVHFMDPEDEVYRRIIMAGKGFGDADNQAPLYLRTTEEMLDEFAYLGSEKAYEVVIKNTNLIADMIEKISPVRPDKCPPVIENSDQMLRDICYNKAHSMYGDPLPEIVHERLERELNSIISNGFAVMYIIAQKLVWKSNEDGYLVGSRGSVGSSFVATMAGITEVNPLVPHYYCSNCHYSDFDSEEVKKYVGGCGHDMPDKNCPVCGQKLVKDGFDIPFEVFAGYEGEKKPDFNLNVPPSYHDCLLTFARDTFGADRVTLGGNGNNHFIIQPKDAEQDEPINISVIACELSDDGEFDNDRAKAAIAGLKPQSLKDYCRIAALLHGTDTWEGNGKELIEKGTCTLQQLICTREDIMNTLLEKGMNRRMAYEIMEHVCKGKANRVDSAKWQEMKVEMRKTGMPKWYIESCEKIKYLFPLGHAVEYVKAREKGGKRYGNK